MPIYRKTACCVLFLAALTACEKESAPDTAAASVSTANTTAEPPALSAVDWTPFFRHWENGCLEEPFEAQRFFDALWKGEVVLPPQYRAGAGVSVSVEDEGDYWNYSLPISGSYYGLPVKSVVRYVGVDNGINGSSLILAVPLATAKAELAGRKVVYRAPTGVGELPYEGFGQAELYEDDNGMAHIDCDVST